MNDQEREAQLDIARANSYGRVIYEGDPRAVDYLAGAEHVSAIRSQLSRIRGELQDIDRKLTNNSTSVGAEGLTLVISYLYTLVDQSDRSFQHRAQLHEALWEDIVTNPGNYVLKPGTSKDDKRG